MAYALLIAPAAQRDLRRLPRSLRERVDAVVRSLRENPRPAGAKRLDRTMHRVRVGDYRLIYAIRDASAEVVLARFGHRREIYKELRRGGQL